MVSQILQDNGFNVKENFGMNTYIIRKALLSKQIDAYVEYTGTGWAIHLNEKKVIRDPEQLFEAVKEEDLKKNSIVWIDRFSFNDTYALAIRKSDVAKYGESLSSLARYVNAHPDETIFAIDHEFYQRPDGFPTMVSFYDMFVDKNQVKTMDIGITYMALSKGQVDVAMVYSTDGLIKKYNLYVLKDDKNFFPIYNPALTIREEVLKKYPEIEKILEPLSRTLTADDIINLNYSVDAEGKDPKNVAINYLKSKGLIGKKP
jgi:osmoprotectant transport system substrate-binding protein